MEAIASPLFLFVAMGAIFYFLLFRPEQAKRKKHQNMLENLSKGDEIVTTG
ncbi:preprotein translocase subunit YajC, partial [Candidatus Poribacteria bacterium]|nr:preprotein translocase subunit YajC [Candidatus Poribacteria bacterium]